MEGFCDGVIDNDEKTTFSEKTYPIQNLSLRVQKQYPIGQNQNAISHQNGACTQCRHTIIAHIREFPPTLSWSWFIFC